MKTLICSAAFLVAGIGFATAQSTDSVKMQADTAKVKIQADTTQIIPAETDTTVDSMKKEALKKAEIAAPEPKKATWKTRARKKVE